MWRPKMICVGASWSTHWCPSEGFHRRLAESMNKWWQHGLTVTVPSVLPSYQRKGSAVLPTLVVYPRVHHTSRKRELLVLAWKGSDHMRRKSPCGAQTLVISLESNVSLWMWPGKQGLLEHSRSWTAKNVYKNSSHRDTNPGSQHGRRTHCQWCYQV